jgi:hypothetical protein
MPVRKISSKNAKDHTTKYITVKAPKKSSSRKKKKKKK